jgi:hypothetical protein
MAAAAAAALIASLRVMSPGLYACWLRVDGIVTASASTVNPQRSYVVWQQPDGCAAALKVRDNDAAVQPGLAAALDDFIRMRHHPGGFMLHPDGLRDALTHRDADADDFLRSALDSRLQTMVAARRICAVLLTVNAERNAVLQVYVAGPLGLPQLLMPTSYDAVIGLVNPQYAVDRFLTAVSTASTPPRT